MAIIEKKGFRFYGDDDGNIKSMIIQSIDIKKEIDYFLASNLKSIVINDTYQNNNIAFLERCPDIEEISIMDYKFDFSGLYNLKKLKNLGFFLEKRSIDLSYFPNLEILSINWDEKIFNMHVCEKVKDLSIWKFRPLIKTFNGIMLPPNIESLHITESNIVNLEGLEYSNLQKIEAYYCSKLESLLGIETISFNLKTIILENCKNLKNFEPLLTCTKIEKIIMTNCGEISSLNGFKQISNLKMFTFFGTNVKDGDLTLLKNVKYVYFKNSKHYNYKLKDFMLN